jgi:hypothetical protein
MHEHLVAFSCKRRGFCPSCGARRMVESAAHLVDHVFPEAPVRQWVLTFPFPLRFLLAAQPEALTQVLAVVQRGISTFVVRHSGLTVSSGARTGAVTLIQRRRWKARGFPARESSALGQISIPSRSGSAACSRRPITVLGIRDPLRFFFSHRAFSADNIGANDTITEKFQVKCFATKQAIY